MSSYTEAISSDALAAWQLLRNEGGYWTTAEMGKALLPDMPSCDSSVRASSWIRALLRRRFVVENTISMNGTPSYGVTSRCFSPPGESLSVEVPQ